MARPGVAQRILAFNHGRRPDTVRLKFAKLRKSQFAFFRGTAHLFYASAPLPAVLAAAPVAGLTGDLHLENFGAYRGANGQVCFNVNDFDEALAGPLAWDLARFVASLYVALAYLKRPGDEARDLAHHFVRHYARAATDGRAHAPEAVQLDGPIGKILHAFPAQAPLDFLDDRGDLTPSGRQLNLANKRFLDIDDGERLAVLKRVADFASQNPATGATRGLDVARLVAGTSSLGLDRYAVLIEGQGAAAPSGLLELLELKEVRASCLAPYLHSPPVGWPSQAARVAAAETLFQSVPPARLGWVGDAAQSFVVRDYARARDRLSVDDPGLGQHHLAETVRAMAQLTAAGHLSSSSAEGARALQSFVHQDGWKAELIDFARAAAHQSHADYAGYCQSFDRGELSPA